MQSIESMGRLKSLAARRQREAAFWQDQLAGDWVPASPLADYPGPENRASGHCSVAIHPQTADKLSAITHDNPAALEVFIAATTGAVLGRLTRNVDVVIGYPATERKSAPTTYDEVLPLRLDVAGRRTFRELLAATRERYLAGLAHQGYPFEVLSQQLAMERSGDRHPLFDVAVEVEQARVSTLVDRSGLLVVVQLIRNPEGLKLSLRFDTTRYTSDTIARLGTLIERALGEGVRCPDRPIGDMALMGNEDSLILARANDTACAYRNDIRLADLLASHAATLGDSVAIVQGSHRLSYRELNRRSNQLAHILRAKGVKRDQLVAVMVERSQEMMVGIFGILKAGAAYLPIDPSLPGARIDHMLADSEATVLLTQSKFRDRVDTRSGGKVCSVIDLDSADAYSERSDAPTGTGDARDLAYAIYTSGSTGLPKAALIEHHSVFNRIDWMQKAFPIGPDDVILQKTTIAFDVSVWELFWWSFVGASVCLLEPGAEKNPEAMIDTIEKHRVTTLHFVPSMLQAFLDYVETTGAIARLASLRQVFASGEALRADQVERFMHLLGRPHGVRLINLYGPTEATVDVSYHECVNQDEARGVPIGRPIDNIRLYVVNEDLRPQPVGVAGELCIAGVGLARSYHRRPELTRERFIDHPFEGEDRIYRTGDLARWLPNGEVEYLGRIDQQVKLRGYRIELAEIEHQLRGYSGVSDAAVIVRNRGIDAVLHAYVQAPGAVDEDALRRHLANKLPEYMIPARLVTLTQFPLTPSGKLDRKALPLPEQGGATAHFEAPVSPVEIELAAIWQRVLGVPGVGRYDNFFASGGTSIHFVTVLAQAKALGLVFSFQDLFAHPTVASLSAAIAVQEAPAQGGLEIQPFALLSIEDRAQVPAGVVDAYPMTMLQAGLIFQNELTFGTAQYHDILTYVIQSRFEEAPFVEAFRHLVSRHAIFRTSYHLRGYSEYVQQVHAELPLPLEIVDLRHMDEADQEAWLSGWAERERQRRFDWENGGLVRLHVHVLRDDLFHYTLDQHNSALDGWSITLVHSQLFDMYYRLMRGETLDGDTGFRNYLRDYVLLEKASIESERDRAFWSGLMENGTHTELSRWQAESEASKLDVVFHDVDISKPLSDALLALADRLAVPLKSILLAAHMMFLSVASAVDDVIAGYEHSGRPELEGATEAIALFLNTIPFRVNVAEAASWQALIEAVYQAEIALLPHRRYPMAQIKNDLGTQAALFETAFNYTHFYRLKALRELPEFELLDIRANSETEFTLRAEFSRHFYTDEVRLSLHYHAHVFTTDQVAAFAGYYRRIFELMVQSADAPLLEDPLLADAKRISLEVKKGRPPTQTFNAKCAPDRTTAGSTTAHAALASDAERQIADVWSKILDIPEAEIGAEDNFFDLGGNSLGAMRAVIMLQRQISLGDFMRNSTLRPLAGRLEASRAAARDLLLDLSPEVQRTAEGGVTLVCFPYAGGHGINYGPLARVLAEREPELKVLAVDLPGRDGSTRDGDLTDVPELAKRLQAELLKGYPGQRLVFWGHCAGAALTLETARGLQFHGREVEHVFIGGKLYGQPDEIARLIDQISNLTDAHVTEILARETGYTELRDATTEMMTTLARAFRHDALCSHRYFMNAPKIWHGMRLNAQLSVVVTSDDAFTPAYATNYLRWNAFSDNVELLELNDGGHFFCRTKPLEVAEIIVERAASRRCTTLDGTQRR